MGNASRAGLASSANWREHALLTALMTPPGRLVYLSSGLEADGRVDLGDLQYQHKAWNGMQAYSDSKLYDVMLTLAVARRWPDVLVSAVDPGWIKTKVEGPGAPDAIELGSDTPVWLATSNEARALVSGGFWKRREQLAPNPSAHDLTLQDGLLEALGAITGVELGAPA